MDDEEFDSEHCLLVKIDPPMSAEDAEVGGDENFNCLEMYMENLTDDDIQSFRFNGTRSYAIVKFVKPISGIKDLQMKSNGKPLLKVYKITLEKIPLVDRVLVTDLPSSLLQSIDNTHDLKDCELVLYFENRKFCPDGGDVVDVKALSCHHAAVVQFADHSVVKKLKASHKFDESHFTVRPLNIFEFVEGPCCSVCSKDNGADDIAEDTTQESWHSTYEDTGSQKKETQSGSQSNSDTDEDIDMLNRWHMKKQDTNSQSQNEHSSFTSEKYSSSKKFAASDNSEINRTRKVTEDSGGFGEVDLADYTVAAQKLNTKDGRKWITELLYDLKIPAVVKNDKSSLILSSNALELAIEAAKTVACSLLPAKIKCDQNKMPKCSKVLQSKTMHVIYRSCKSGYLELLGIPMDVIKAVGEIEKLLGSRW